jgi:hypothetical protein
MASNMTTPNNIDYDNLTMTDKITLGSGASFVNLKYNDQMCLFKLPKITCFGVDTFEDPKTSEKKSTMSVQFKKEQIESDESVKNAVEGLKQFEQHIKEWARKNSQELFKKKNASADFIEATFNSILKSSKDKDTEEPDGRYYTLKIKLKPNKKDEEKFDFGAFTSSKEKMNITKDNVSDLIKKWGQVKVVVSPNIWIISGKIGVSWNLWQLKYWEPEGGVVLNKEEVCMIDSSDDEDEDEDGDEQECISDSD